MKTLLVSAFALGAMTSLALAEPLTLTDTQMDQVTAGACGDGDCFVGGSGVGGSGFHIETVHQDSELTLSGGGSGVGGGRRLTQSDSTCAGGGSLAGSGGTC